MQHKDKGRELIRVEASLPVKYALLTPEDYERIKKEFGEGKRGLAGGMASFPLQIKPGEWEKAEVAQQDLIIIQMLLGIHQKLDRLLKLLEEKEVSPFQEGLAIAIDISGSGMRLEIDKELQYGNILHLKFDLPIIPPVALEVLGKVMWVKALAQEPKKYHSGVHFTSINEGDRDLIIRYTFLRQRILLKERWKESKGARI